MENKISDVLRKQDENERLNELFANAEGSEDAALREEHIKVFNLGGNRHQAVIYPEPVHFRDPKTGKWQDIDNTLEETVTAIGRRMLRNHAGRVRMEFPVRMDGGCMASITDGDHTFAWRFEQEPQPILAAVRTGLQMQKERLIQMARALPKFVGRTLESLETADLPAELENAQERRAALPRLNAENTYEGVLPGVSVRYSVNGETLKEDIILASADALSRAAIRLPKDYDYEVTEQSELRVKDRETGETRFIMRRPNVYDSSGEEVFASVVLSDMDEYVRMEYVVDAAFMESAAYPVTIDPIVQTSTTNVSVCDAYIWKKNPNTNYGDVSLMRCGTGSGGESISLIKFNKLIRLKASDTVLSATLRVSALNYPSDPEIMGCYPIKSAWTETGVTWNKMTPDNDTHISRTMSAYIPATKPTYCYFDITSEYRGWYLKDANGNSRNFGVALRRPPEVTTGGNYVEWTGCKHNSSKGPCVIVNYVSHAGRKSWWQYESMSAGRAGSAYVDLFNGNLVFEHADGATTGNRMPVAISHVYNSCLSESNPVSCGNGWRTNMHQSVCRKAIGSTNYYVWTDGDATEHFFAISGSQPYTDAEGMSLKLTTTSTELTIADKGDTKLVFPLPADANQKFLLRMTDACGNSTSLSYDASGRLAGVTDGVGRVTTLNYNAAGLLSQIAVPGRPAVTYSYTGTQLTGVGYGDITGRTTYTYEETSNMLVSAVNYDGVRVDLTYEGLNAYDSAAIDNYAAQVRRIIAMETRSDSIRGAKQRFDYEHMMTKVTAVTNPTSEAGKTITYQFNDAGNVVCCFDELGFVQSGTFATDLDADATANQQTSASRFKRVVINHLTNLDFSSGWTTAKGAAGDTAVQGTDHRCLNMPSLKMTKTSAAETRHYQTVAVPAAGQYTFSSYVKNTAALASGSLFLRIRSGGSVWESRKLTGITAAYNTDSAADGWDRLYVTANLPAGSVTLELVSTASSGSAWFSCPQLETGSIANHVNLLLNGDFTRTYVKGSQTFASDWSISEGISTNALNGVVPHADAGLPAGLGGNASRIYSVCNTSASSHCQSIAAKGAKGDVFVVGGWVNATSVASGKTPFKPCLITRFLGTDGKWSDLVYNEYPAQRVGWKYQEWAIVAPKAYKEFRIGYQYARNIGTAMFSNLFIHREQFGQSYAYDAKNNVVSVSSLSAQKSAMEYDDANNLKSYRQPGAAESAQYTMSYGASKEEQQKHLLKESVTTMGQRDVFTHDSYGNALTSIRQKSGDSAFIKTESTYTADGNYKAATRDARGNVVTQNVNATDGTLTSVTDPNGQTVSYTYDASKRVTGVETTAGGKTYKNAYTYANDRIQKVQHNTTSDTPDVEYAFGYDALGRKTAVKVGNQTLSTNVYTADRSGLLSEVQYGNGGKVKYAYDAYDRLTGMKYDGETTDRYTYEYGADGEASVVCDNNLGRVLQTEHDLAQRAMGTQLCDANGNLLYRTELDYDTQNRLVGFGETASGRNYKTAYTYDNDNRVTGMTFDGGNAIGYTYDSLGRIATRTASPLSTSYGYVAGGYGTGSTTPLVASIQQNGIAYTYAYDSRGNIISETRNGQTTTYAYDALGQLIRVNDPHLNQTWVYNYDRGGNILSKARYAYTTGTLGTALETIPYAYGDSNWKDKLTAYNGKAITYDAIGNPLNDGTWTYQWQAGRQLKQVTKSGTTIQFKYDHNGLRVGKVVNGTETKYMLHGKLVTHLTVGSDNLHFFYDAQSRPAKVSYNGVLYTYIHNLQGDVVGLLDNSGALVVEYKYDAWGKAISTTGSLAATLGKRNPFRYRGYVYDEETGLYYLKSRYYDSEMQRFLNADTLMGGVGNILAHNMCFYAANNPIMCVDDHGKSFDWFMSAVENEDLYNAYWDLPLITQGKHTGFGAIGALLTINAHQDCIQAAADEFGIEKEMIEAVLFRELICVGLDDVAADLRFRITGQDCSTGIGQIFASTAIAAEKSVTGTCNKSVSEMWYALQDECTNIRYVAMNIKSILNKNDLEMPNGEDASMYSSCYLVFARYNAKTLGEKAKAYATAVEKYYKAFKSLRGRY